MLIGSAEAMGLKIEASTYGGIGEMYGDAPQRMSFPAVYEEVRQVRVIGVSSNVRFSVMFMSHFLSSAEHRVA